jgi:hypothetical protein
MEYRIKDYQIDGNSIVLPRETGIEDIRLIYNETQKVLICSTAKKENLSGLGVFVTDVIGKTTTIRIPTSICVLNEDDQLTIKCDYGDDLSSVESKVEEVGNKIDNIKLPEINTTNIASKDLERFFGVKPIEGYEFMTAEEVCSELEEIMTSMDLGLTQEQAKEITNNTLNKG